jgi:hypothetical protein
MRVEIINGRKLVCGHIYPLSELAVGQQWAQADGTDRVVVIRVIEGEQILYGDHASDRVYEKDWFNFQCRFCKVVE